MIEVSDSRYPSIEKVADNIVKSCEAKGFKTQYEKALFLHDWITNNASYDHSLEYDGESGVLIRGTGTCESYHRAFTLLLNRMGIQCERATGNGHVWSCVKLDGKWTQIDPTWNGEKYTGSLAFMNHLYFGITDDMMKQVHSDHKPNASRPCTSYDSNYFLRSGEISRWTAPPRAADSCARQGWPADELHLGGRKELLPQCVQHRVSASCLSADEYELGAREHDNNGVLRENRFDERLLQRDGQEKGAGDRRGRRWLSTRVFVWLKRLIFLPGEGARKGDGIVEEDLGEVVVLLF